MGSGDTTASLAKGTSHTTSVKAVNTDTLTPGDAAASLLRNTLVDQIRAKGHVRTDRVETALRAVLRHLFVPEASLEAAYANRRRHQVRHRRNLDLLGQTARSARVQRG